MSLKITTSLLALVFGLAPLSQAVAPRSTPSQDPILKDSDLAKVSKAITTYFEAKEKNKKVGEAEEEFGEVLDKVGKGLRRSGIDDLLASPSDMGRALWMSFNYPKKRVKKGKMENLTFAEGLFADKPLEYSLWIPSKYNPKTTAYPIIISIPDTDETPSDHLIERWQDAAVREGAILVSPTMPEEQSDWLDRPGFAAIFSCMRATYEVASTDFNRVYISGRGAGVAAAVAIADKFPHRFAGVIGRAGDAGPTSIGNFSNLPSFFAGGGGEATAFEKAAIELGWKNVTIASDALEADIWAWIQDNERKAYPDEVILHPGKPFPSRAYWLGIPPGSGDIGSKIHAKLDREGNAISIDADGVNEITIFLSDAMLDLSKPVKVTTNGTEVIELVPRSRPQFLTMAYQATIDAGEIFVARLTVTVPKKPVDSK